MQFPEQKHLSSSVVLLPTSMLIFVVKCNTKIIYLRYNPKGLLLHMPREELPYFWIFPNFTMHFLPFCAFIWAQTNRERSTGFEGCTEPCSWAPAQLTEIFPLHVLIDLDIQHSKYSFHHREIKKSVKKMMGKSGSFLPQPSCACCRGEKSCPKGTKL